MKKDRKDRDIEVGDVVAFDIPVLFGTEEHQNKMWDIFWGVVKEEGIEVEYCPISQKKDAIYRIPEDPSEVLIIKKRPPYMEDLGSPAQQKEILELEEKIKSLKEKPQIDKPEPENKENE